MPANSHHGTGKSSDEQELNMDYRSRHRSIAVDLLFTASVNATLNLTESEQDSPGPDYEIAIDQETIAGTRLTISTNDTMYSHCFAGFCRDSQY